MVCPIPVSWQKAYVNLHIRYSLYIVYILHALKFWLASDSVIVYHKKENVQ